MDYQARFWRRPWVRVVLLATAVAAAPLPVLAEEAVAPATPAPGIATSAQKAVAAAVRSSARTPAFAQDTGAAPKTDLGSNSFFKKPAGIITLAVLGAGTAFALYSTSHDRVKSPAR